MIYSVGGPGGHHRRARLSRDPAPFCPAVPLSEEPRQRCLSQAGGSRSVPAGLPRQGQEGRELEYAE
jgi:hypothetical protein